MALSVVKAESDRTHSAAILGTLTADNYGDWLDPATAPIHLEFDDGSTFAVYDAKVTGEPRNYAHDLLDDYLAAGGTIL